MSHQAQVALFQLVYDCIGRTSNGWNVIDGYQENMLGNELAFSQSNVDFVTYGYHKMFLDLRALEAEPTIISEP